MSTWDAANSGPREIAGLEGLAFQRVVVIGTTGSGKSTVAANLAARLGVPHVELDALYHGPKWVPAPTETFRARISEATTGAGWVADGNYIETAQTLLWPNADLIVWLDLPLPIVLIRVVRRSLGRILRRTELWHGNRETWSALFGRSSMVTWTISSHRRHRRDLPVLLAPPHLVGVHVLRLRSTRELRDWMATVS